MSGAAQRERLNEPRPRLIAARARKYATPEEAAVALGIPAPTYRAHENGSRGLSRNAERYARFFGVSLEWLLTGRGAMSGGALIPVRGRIGAGALVEAADDAFELESGEHVELPSSSATEAFVVQGESMLPRFLPGEVLLFERQPALSPAVLVGQYCRVQTLEEGRIFIKILWPGRAGTWTLSSHNGAVMQNVELLAAWRWVGLLPPRDGKPAPIPGVRI
jgi:phage repressor protein C with HTH and peptisase S24 domain